MRFGRDGQKFKSQMPTSANKHPKICIYSVLEYRQSNCARQGVNKKQGL